MKSFDDTLLRRQPTPEMLRVLRELSRQPQTLVFVISQLQSKHLERLGPREPGDGAGGREGANAREGARVARATPHPCETRVCPPLYRLYDRPRRRQWAVHLVALQQDRAVATAEQRRC